jgi:hypothetical protein
LATLYNAAEISEESYRNKLKEYGYSSGDETDFDQQETLDMLKNEIKNDFFKKPFFSYPIIKDIEIGKLKDLKPYSSLTFEKASDKYDKSRVFKEGEPIKTYSNGFKWIDVGSKCYLVGKQMKNCGSAGVMSTDPDKTIITLFDKNNKPHVMVTYSPNEKRISGDEGQASSAVKEKYHDYILDLAQHLNANFDESRTKSKLLKLKSALKGKYSSIEELSIGGALYEYFKIIMKDGSVYYTNSYEMIPEEEVKKHIPEFSTLRKTLDELYRDRNRNFADLQQFKDSI